MTTERRFNEEEIRTILKQASADDRPVPRHSDGLTLAELTQIGEEAGISAEAITRATAALDVSAPTTTLGASIGMHLSTTQSADLGHSFSDEDWDRLVADVEQSFRVVGERRAFGTVREWKSDKLTVVVEPTASGHRLNLRADDHAGKLGLIGGALFLAMGLFFTLLVVAKAGTPDLAKILFTSMFSVVGLGGMGYSAVRTRSWSAETNRHLEAIAVRAVEHSGVRQAAAEREPEPPSRIDAELLSGDEGGRVDKEIRNSPRQTRT